MYIVSYFCRVHKEVRYLSGRYSTSKYAQEARTFLRTCDAKNSAASWSLCSDGYQIIPVTLNLNLDEIIEVTP